jgi:phosphate-selective porin
MIALWETDLAVAQAQDAPRAEKAEPETQQQTDPKDTQPPPAPRPWNRLESKWVNAQAGGGIALDFVRYHQYDSSLQQVGDLTEFERPEIRALRLGVAGTFNFTKPWLWYVAGAYRGFDRGFDQSTQDAWALFDLSLTVPIEKLGSVTVGKTKEPFSMERLMGGGVMPATERSMGIDALTSARNIGIQLGNHFAGKRMTWRGGVFNDWLFTEESFSASAIQYIGRLTGLPLNQPEGIGLLHLGISGRYSASNPRMIRFKNSPEVFEPVFVDTGDFSAEDMTNTNLEVYYQKGPFWLATEYLYANIRSPANGDPSFRAFFVQPTWVLNGETRPYMGEVGIFGTMRPEKNVTDGGAGLFEVGARYSMVDLEDGSISGGEMSRLTGIFNWYLSSGALTSFNYGLVRLDRGGTVGYTNIFQLRLFLFF